MKQQMRFLILSVICGYIFLFAPSQALAGDGGVSISDDTYPAEVDISNGDDVGVYASDSVEQSEGYDGISVQVSESSQLEDWDKVTSGDWEQQEGVDNNKATSNVGNQETILNEMIDNGEMCENKVTAEEPDSVSSGVSSECPSSGTEAITATDNVMANAIGDVNKDGTIDALDCALLQGFIQGKQDAVYKEQADFNGDGQISMLDVYAILNLVKSEGKGTGDVNGDGKINNYDIQAITAYMAKQTTSVNQQNADLNGDGEIDGKDLMILREVVKVRTH